MRFYKKFIFTLGLTVFIYIVYHTSYSQLKKENVWITNSPYARTEDLVGESSPIFLLGGLSAKSSEIRH
jgi:hypothetical protein